jgi:hypothetical protein
MCTVTTLHMFYQLSPDDIRKTFPTSLPSTEGAVEEKVEGKIR